MVNAFVQFRIEEEQREQAAAICDRLGIDLATYLRICIAKLIRDDGVPFSMRLSQNGDEAGDGPVVILKKTARPRRGKARREAGTSAAAPAEPTADVRPAERPAASASRSAGIVDMSMD